MMMRVVRSLQRPVQLLQSATIARNARGLSSSELKTAEVEKDNPTERTNHLSLALKPKEVVEQLDKFIVGQPEAKRAVAIALRNRWRRHQLGEDLRNEVIPKNILMIGPTGCGKTEIARRIARLSQAPFIKVEATKFTEVGFHGKDVDQIIRDLVDVSINMTKKRIKEEARMDVSLAVEERILDFMIGYHADLTERETYRTLLRKGAMNDRDIEIDVPIKPQAGAPGVGGFDSSNLNDIFRMAKGAGSNPAGVSGFSISGLGGLGVGGAKTHRRRMTIAEARPIIEEIELEKLVENYDVTREAIQAVEQSGIVFIDEIDKLISTGDYRGADASSEGVQRDLLPLIEGSTVTTKHGNVNTDFILFIASGAFQAVKPSELLAELQGRLPIRVTLAGLTEEDLYSILTEPVNNLIRQQIEMMKAEKVDLVITDEAIRKLAHMAFTLNKSVENIGARRLHTVIERVMEEISFTGGDVENSRVVIDADYVQSRMKDMVSNVDLSRYIL